MRVSLNMEVYEVDFQAAADLFLSTLKIQDDLPPIAEQPTQVPTAFPTPHIIALPNHYEEELLAFDYPQGLSQLPPGEGSSSCFPNFPYGGEWLIGLGDSRFQINGIYYHCILVNNRPWPSGSNMEAVLLGIYEQIQARDPLEPSSLLSTGPIRVAGQIGFQWVFRMTAGEPSYELRDIWWEPDNRIYIISIRTEFTSPNDFWAFNSEAQALLDSLIIK